MSENILDIQLTNRNVFLLVLQGITLGTLLIEHPVEAKQFADILYVGQNVIRNEHFTVIEDTALF